MQKSILFVCQANLCRSPAAKAVFEKYLDNLDLRSRFCIESAGLEVEPCTRSFWMNWVAYRRGYCLGKRPKRVLRADLVKYDLIVAMDDSIAMALKNLHSNPQATIKLLGDFIDPSGMDVPDPMNRSAKTCHRVFDMLECACPQIVQSFG